MAPFIRIFLRWVAAFLVSHGVLSPEDTHIFADDPDLILATDVLVGIIIGVLVELWYIIARKLGWRK